MKNLFSYTLIAAFTVLAFTQSCKKSDDSSSSASMSATVNGNAWNATIDSAYNFGSQLWIYGMQISGSNAQVISLILPSVPTAAGAISIATTGGATATYGTNTTGSSAVYGTINISAISATNVTGTFSFTCVDSTKVTGGSFNITRR